MPLWFHKGNLYQADISVSVLVFRYWANTGEILVAVMEPVLSAILKIKWGNFLKINNMQEELF